MTNTLMAPPTLLGQGPAAIATGGKIRAGIKVLTKKAAENPQARDIYERGVACGQSFDEIEQLLGQALPDLWAPLVPKNVAWFTVRGQDFPNPELARQILDAFGEERGDGVKRLYRFPVVFPSDTWQAVMPHELVTWGANEKKFWSEYAADGRTRYCKCYAPAALNDSGKRVIRVFGGRKTTLRSEHDGLCEPERCAEYQQRQCNLSGRFLFFMPGIKSISAFELHTNSFYAMHAAIRKFETIAFMRGGRISGFLDANQTPFYITKKLRDVPHIDENGRAVRVRQWIIELEAPIDVTALLRAQDDEETAIVHAQLASRILEGPAGNDGAEHAAPVESPMAETLPEAGANIGGGSEAGVAANAAPESAADAPSDSKTAAAPCTGRRSSAHAANASPSLEQVIETARAHGVDAQRYERYADRRWGSGWKFNARGRRGALEELERYRNDPQGLRDKVAAN